MLSRVVHRANGDRVYTIGVSVKVALIIETTTIPARKNEDRSLALSSVVDAIHNSFPDEIAWAFHSCSVISGSPAAAVYRNVLESVVKCSSFVDSRNWTTQDANSGGLGVVRNTNSASFVSSRDDLASASCAMMVSHTGWAR